MERSRLGASILTAIWLVLVVGGWTPAGGDDGCCCQCGIHCATRKVCRPVLTTRLVECIEWGVACDELCLAPRSCKSDLCGSSCSCDEAGGLFASPLLDSSHSKMRSRKRLLRKTLIQRVPVMEYIVVDMCGQCSQGLAPVVTEPGGFPPMLDGTNLPPTELPPIVNANADTGFAANSAADGLLGTDEPINLELELPPELDENGEIVSRKRASPLARFLRGIRRKDPAPEPGM